MKLRIFQRIFVKSPTQSFTKVPSDTNQLICTDRLTDMMKLTAVSRQFTNQRTQNDLHATSHTFTRISLSDMTADHTFRHVLPSVF